MKLLVKVIISVMVVLFVAGCSRKGQDCPGTVQSSRTLRPLVGQQLEMSEEINKISWDGVHYRNDIGKKALDRRM